jgi:hypothetical protein
VTGYNFDLGTNTLIAEKMANPSAGTQHVFSAFRLQNQSDKEVTMATNQVNEVSEIVIDEIDEE